jgi:hypothetical protein
VESLEVEKSFSRDLNALAVVRSATGKGKCEMREGDDSELEQHLFDVILEIVAIKMPVAGPLAIVARFSSFLVEDFSLNVAADQRDRC